MTMILLSIKGNVADAIKACLDHNIKVPADSSFRQKGTMTQLLVRDEFKEAVQDWYTNEKVPNHCMYPVGTLLLYTFSE